MSAVSSSDDVAATKPLGGWKAALASLFAAAGIFTLVPIVATVAVIMFVQLSGQHHGDLETWFANSVPAQFFYFLLAESLTVLTVFGLIKLFRWNWQSIGMRMPKWYHPLLGIAAAIPYFLILLLVIQAVSWLVPGFDINQKQEIGFDSVRGSTEMLLTFFSLVILPPIAEEITMRGFLYTGLRKWLPRIAAALLVSVLFGAAHLSEGGAAGPLWIGALDTCILSLVLIALREMTGNLWAGITLHMTKNFVAFLALFVFVGR